MPEEYGIEYWIRRNIVPDTPQEVSVSMPQVASDGSKTLNITAEKQGHIALLALLRLLIKHGKFSCTGWNGRTHKHIQIDKDYMDMLKEKIDKITLHIERKDNTYYISLQPLYSMNPEISSAASAWGSVYLTPQHINNFIVSYDQQYLHGQPVHLQPFP